MEMHVYGSSIGQTANPASDIDVLLVVEHERDEIIRFLKWLDLSLTTCYRQLVGLKREPKSLLDIHLINRNEQTERVGPGALLSGLHTRPICLMRS